MVRNLSNNFGRNNYFNLFVMSAIEDINLPKSTVKKSLDKKVKAYFSELGRVDASAIPAGELKHFGVAKLPLVLPPKEIIETLIFSRQIETGKNLAVSLELETEEKSAKSYTAYFAVTKKTRSKNNTYAFAVKISKITGEIDVIGI